jgi:hypothetical protein
VNEGFGSLGGHLQTFEAEVQATERLLEPEPSSPYYGKRHPPKPSPLT